MANFESASGSALSEILDFNAQGRTAFETLTGTGVRSAREIAGAIQAGFSDSTSNVVNFSQAANEQMGKVRDAGRNTATAIAGALGAGMSDSKTNVLSFSQAFDDQMGLIEKAGTAAAETLSGSFHTSVDRITGILDGVNLGVPAPISLPNINIPGVTPNVNHLGNFNTGGSFTVPGSGATDRLYSIGLTPQERVTVTRPGQSGGANNPSLEIEIQALRQEVRGSNKRLEAVVSEIRNNTSHRENYGDRQEGRAQVKRMANG